MDAEPAGRGDVGEGGGFEDEEFEEDEDEFDEDYEDGEDDEDDDDFDSEPVEPGGVRRATPRDAEELTRLRAVMIEAMGPILDDGWREPCVDAFAAALADPDGPLQAFVVDAPDQPGVLASCCVGVIQPRLPSPHNPTGMIGYLLNVATDPAHRRRGYGRAVVMATLDWLRDCGIERVDLHASPDGEQMYRDLGFHESRAPALTLWMKN